MDGTMIDSFTKGSETDSMVVGSGSRAGLSTWTMPPRRSLTSYSTVGAVVIRSSWNSRSRRSCTISRCSRPRKPQRKPEPSAVELVGVHRPDPRARQDLAIDDPHICDDASVRVVVRVEDERPQRRARVAPWRRHARDDRLEDVLRADAELRRGEDHLRARKACDVGDLLGDHLGLRGVEPDLVDHRHDARPGPDRL